MDWILKNPDLENKSDPDLGKKTWIPVPIE